MSVSVVCVCMCSGQGSHGDVVASALVWGGLAGTSTLILRLAFST